MSQFKKQIIGAVCATLLTIVAVFAFGVIAQSYSAGFGEFAKQSTQLAIEKHFGKCIAVLVCNGLCQNKADQTSICDMGYSYLWGLLCSMYAHWQICVL